MSRHLDLDTRNALTLLASMIICVVIGYVCGVVR